MITFISVSAAGAYAGALKNAPFPYFEHAVTVSVYTCPRENST